jgi:hypothetical protein
MLKFFDLPKTVLIILFLWMVLFLELQDPDYFWHLEAGKKALADGALLWTDPFTFTNHGLPWVPTEWLFQVVLAGFHGLLGDTGSRLLMAMLGSGVFWVTYSATRRFRVEAPLAILVTLAFFSLLSPFLAPRPQLVSYFFFATYLHVLLGFKYGSHVRALAWLPLLMVVWVNAHSGFMVGIVLLALACGCEWLLFWYRRHQGAAESPSALVRLTGIAVLTLLASAINPEWFEHWLYPFRILQMEVVKGFILEWQSPNFHAPVFKVYLTLMLGFFLLYIYQQKKPDLTETALPLFFIAASLVSLRHIPLAVLTMAPFAARALAEGGSLGGAYRRLAGRGEPLGDMEYKLNCIVVMVAAVGMMAFAPLYHARAAEKVSKDEWVSLLPTKATEFILKAGITGRMLNTYHYGGYLIHRLYPAQRVFIDGRADMLGDKFIREYSRIYQGEPDWEPAFDKLDIDYVVCERRAPIRQLLLTRGDFALVYDDKQHSVLVRKLPRFAPVIEKYGFKG